MSVHVCAEFISMEALKTPEWELDEDIETKVRMAQFALEEEEIKSGLRTLSGEWLADAIEHLKL